MRRNVQPGPRGTILVPQLRNSEFFIIGHCPNFPLVLVYIFKMMLLQNSTYPEPGYTDRFGPSGKCVENPTKISCLEITGYRIKYSRLSWLLELQIRLGRKVQTQVHPTYFRLATQSIFEENPINQIVFKSRWLAVPINPNKWSSTVLFPNSVT